MAQLEDDTIIHIELKKRFRGRMMKTLMIGRIVWEK